MPARLLLIPRFYWPIFIGAIPTLALAMLTPKSLMLGYVRAALAFADGHSRWSSIAAGIPDLGPASLLILAAIGRIAHTERAIGMLLAVFGTIIILGAAWIVARAVRTLWSSAAIALNPGLMLVNGLLGPFDLAGALLVTAAAIALMRDRLAPAWLATIAAIAFMPTAIAFVPLLLVVPLLRRGAERTRAWRASVLGALGGLAILTATGAAFGSSFHPVEVLAWLFAHYPNGFTSYHFNSSGALNLYAVFGQTWRPETMLAGPLPIATWGYLLFAVIVAMIVRQFMRDNKPEAVPLAAFLVMFAVFIFPPRIYPAQMAYAAMLVPLTLSLSRRAIVAMLLLALSLALNALLVAYRLSIPAIDHTIALLNVSCFFGVAYLYLGSNIAALDTIGDRFAAFMPRRSAVEEPSANPAMNAVDYAFASALMIVFVALAFFKFWDPPTKNFDEIYYVRAGAEYLKHMEIFESTHPPLSKLIIALSMLVGGDHPFGWRLFNVIIGMLQIGVVYLFAKRWLRSSAFAAVAAGIVTFDGFHFAQSRIATPEITVGFFTIVTLYCFYRYWSAGSAPDAQPPPPAPFIQRGITSLLFGGALGTALFWTSSTNAKIAAALYVAVCTYALSAFATTRFSAARLTQKGAPALWFWMTALAMGALAATKWNGLGTFAAIIVIFVAVTLYRRLRGSHAWGAFGAVSADAFLPTMFAVAATMYLLAYIPYFSLGHRLDEFLQLQAGMYRYHSTLVFTHPYSSAWWEWPLILRPIAYVINNTSHNNTLPCCIAVVLALPNPATWWFGLISVPYSGYAAWIERNKGAAVIVVAYLMQWLPWILSPRLAFEYHFYPNASLIALGDAFLLQRVWTFPVPVRWQRALRSGVVIYVGIALIAFAYWYPIVAAQPITLQAYQNRMWHWLMGNRWM